MGPEGPPAMPVDAGHNDRYAVSITTIMEALCPTQT